MGWISTRELIARGIPASALQKAESDGKLRSTRLTDTERAYDTAAVDAWLSGKPVAQSDQARAAIADYQRQDVATVRREQAARDAARPEAPLAVSSPSAVVSRQRSAEETLACLVGHVAFRENITEVEARQKVLRGSPDLRERLVAEANTDRPRGGVREREDLRESAAAYSDSMPTR